MDASVTWNATCPLSDSVAYAQILAKSFYDSMSPLLNGDLQNVNVYELCNQVIQATPYSLNTRHLESSESEIKLKNIMTSTCNSCAGEMYQSIDEALDTIVADGSLNSNIQSNLNDTMSISVTGVITTSYSTITNSPTKVPTETPTTLIPPTKNPSQHPSLSPTASPSTSQLPPTTAPVTSSPTSSLDSLDIGPVGIPGSVTSTSSGDLVAVKGSGAGEPDWNHFYCLFLLKCSLIAGCFILWLVQRHVIYK